ncbi:MAG: amino acid ABC transporter ATP-binding protein [Lachnospiraceae bacterium]|nr:amino acid ABC transporter ATP-binding protein [Lachnospiraceae bacterium]
MLKIENLTKEYADVSPVKDVSVTINDGDVIAVIGPSGAGKSTFIRCINMLEKPTSGQIFLGDEEITAKGYDIKKARQRMGMVFQSFNLFGHLTVIENLMLAPMDLLKKSRQEAYDKGMELLKQVGMAEKALSYPEELSGGQKQRVAIARTLCMDPEVILLDEPTSALDPTMVSEVQAVIRQLSESGKTMLIVTHEMEFARAISNRVFYMDDGGIYEEGTPEEIFDHPQKELTRRFIKKLKLFEQVINSKSYDFIGFNSELEKYLFKNDVSNSDRFRIMLALEELVQQIILPKLDDPFIRVRVEYSLKEESCQIIVNYKGERFDIDNTDNDLSLSLLRNTAKEVSYSFNEAEEEPNCVKIQIRHKK